MQVLSRRTSVGPRGWELSFTSCKSSTLLDHTNIFLSLFIFICQLRMQSGCNDCNQCSKLHVDICWHLEFVKSRDRAQRAADSAPQRSSPSRLTVEKFKGIIYLFDWMTYTGTINCVLSFTAVPLSDASFDPPLNIQRSSFKRDWAEQPTSSRAPFKPSFLSVMVTL